MTSNAAKRQRQKEQKREKIREEIRARQARQRRRRSVNVTILAVLVGVVAFFVFQGQNESKSKSDAKPDASGCTHNKPKTGNTDTPDAPPAMVIDPAKSYTAVVQTSCGSVEVELAAATSPNAVNAFVVLARQGFYNGLPFHRIVKDFAVQGGDPKGDGTGGPKYKTVDPPPPDFKYVKGTVAMAKGGDEPAGTAGSQFFFVPGDGAKDTLTPDYAVLGKVVKGESALDKLNNVKTEAKAGSPEESSPVEPVYIEKITIKEGAAAPTPAPPPPGQ